MFAPSSLAVAGECVAIIGLFALLEHFGQRIEITESAIRDDRTFNALSVTIHKAELMSCRYKVVVFGRPIQFSVIELVDQSGKKVIDVRRYGWGRRSKQLFRSIGQWVLSSDISVDECTSRKVREWSGDDQVHESHSVQPPAE